jgi:hypothetical protein
MDSNITGNIITAIAMIVSATIGALATYIVGKKKKPDQISKISMVTLNQARNEIGSVEIRIDQAKDEIRVSGLDCKYVAEANSGRIEEALKRNVKVKIICVDPKGPAAQLIPIIDPRIHDTDHFIKSVNSVIGTLSKIKSKYPDKFEYRLVPVIPPLSMFIIDPNRKEGLIKFEVYPVPPYGAPDSRPHFVLSKDDLIWRSYMLRQWDNLWEIGRIG